MTTLDKWSLARAEKDFLARASRAPEPADRPCWACDGSGEGKHGGWCDLCGGDGIDPKGHR